MSDDDLVPDEALVVRLEQGAHAIQAVADMLAVRTHLPVEGVTELSRLAWELVGEMNAAKHPDDEINAKYRSRMRGQHIYTSCGIRFFPWDPKPEEVAHLDIVIGLVNTARYNGQTSKQDAPHIPRPVSVGEHSIKTAAIAELLCERDGLGPELTHMASLHALLHDAHEAYMGDTVRPMKGRLYDAQTGRSLSACEGTVQDAILMAYSLPPLPVEVDSIVHEADMLAYACEVMSIRRHTEEQDNRAIPVVTPHIATAGRIKAEAPQRDAVRALLDAEIQRLVKLVGGVIPGPQRPPQAAQATVDPVHALETLAKLKQVPGHPYKALGPEEHDPRDTGYIPQQNIQRAPRADDVSESSWQQNVEALNVPMPVQLIAEIKTELGDPATTDLKRKVLQEELTRLESVIDG